MKVEREYQVKQIVDYDIKGKMKAEIQELLNECFGDGYPDDRIYFKQIPHFRYLVHNEDQRLVGHVGVDYRVMKLEGEPINVLGVIDLCVSKGSRSLGIGSQLLFELERFCNGRNIDFLLLFADDPSLYKRNGFQSVSNQCTWMKINDQNQTTRGIGTETINQLMIKPIGTKKWSSGQLDMLGYLY
ncbi:GNAT family N-acetyltransferase [uncultured Rossellomorea sp.]|uniref:GNAT family N-acetyltransferase n=1 Tax=uncultured Rossellomorea sp. TaxID=2837549 RepID=UPI00261BB331|nr:GNAT family N-acetyltransferase [uncultured Rossellomorea sp.]